MKEWRDELDRVPLLSPAELEAKVEQMRTLVESPAFTYETYDRVNDLEGQLRLVVRAMLVRGTASQQRAAHTALAQLSR